MALASYQVCLLLCKLSQQHLSVTDKELDMGASTYCEALKLELLPNTSGPWHFNQLELWASLLSRLCAKQLLALGMWVLSGSVLVPLYLLHGKENPAGEKYI